MINPSNYSVVKVDQGLPTQAYIIRGKCVITGKEHSVRVPPQEYYDYFMAGKLAQDALKSLSAEDREFLISGIAPDGWSAYEDDDDR